MFRWFRFTPVTVNLPKYGHVRGSGELAEISKKKSVRGEGKRFFEENKNFLSNRFFFFFSVFSIDFDEILYDCSYYSAF